MEATHFTNTAFPDLLEVRDVNQTYDRGKTWTIKDFNLLIEDDKKGLGQFIVILGKSGCGKSTVLKYIAGLQKPTSGQILINEKPFHGNIPMVFQKYSSIPWLTVLENVLLPLKIQGQYNKEHKAKALEMLKAVGLLEHKDKYAQDTVLSGGQLQRVAIARCLVADPKVLLMDEPFGALDIYTRFKMQLMLCRLWMTVNSIIIFVTHDIPEAVFLADKIYIMDSNPGRIIKAFNIDLPYERDRDTKRTKRYVELVNEVEDTMFELLGIQTKG